jgi:TonB family protein
MKCSLHLGIALCVACTALLFAQNKQSTTEQKGEPPTANSDEKRPNQPDSGTNHGPIGILSDTGGVDVLPYLNRSVLPLLKTSWYKRIPESDKMKSGKVSIVFRVWKDGRITDVHYSDSSGDPDLDRPAYDSIRESSPLPSLPSGFPCNYLALKFRFYYNLKPVPFEQPRQLTPCVTTKIGVGGPVGVAVSPGSAEVVTGAKQQFVAIITGELGSKVEWKVSGSGCSGSTCGSVSSEGLYAAPSTIPSPPKVIVSAISQADPTETGSAAVTVVQSPTSH